MSQMFGEMIGLWCVDAWERLGRPAAFRLVEIGPGRGTLMKDALRAARVAPAFIAAAAVDLVEVSPTLRALQTAALADARTGGGISWHAELGSVPAGPLILAANELLDALPIHQYQRTLAGWRERLVDVAADGAFRFVLSDPSSSDPITLPEAFSGAPIGAIVEVSPAAQALIEDIARRLTAAHGIALFIDIGRSESAPAETLQAVRSHAGHPVLDAPGTADLSAYVDFAVLRQVARAAGAQTFGPVTQGQFLQALGIELRASRLKTGKTPDAAGAIDVALRRLVDADQMGAMFKVMAIAEPSLAALAGFGEVW
ncbi:MAG: class I SAM-dependent methyltransferase [Alphaproteobacteria bacterium]|nr:class I SAM-dependent methyltransferase [Alphaproteobacteria bacterium]